MRMNPDKGLTAAELIEELDETQLANILYNFGEEKLSRRIARRIKRDIAIYGPYSGTSALAYAVAGCYPPKQRHGRIHPATRTFQALRIAVNDELHALERLLAIAPEWIAHDGLFTIISFHSLEDRLIKKSFLNDKRLYPLTRKPLVAKEQEIKVNSRSRSAKCRIARRI